ERCDRASDLRLVVLQSRGFVPMFARRPITNEGQNADLFGHFGSGKNTKFPVRLETHAFLPDGDFGLQIFFPTGMPLSNDHEASQSNGAVRICLWRRFRDSERRG